MKPSHFLAVAAVALSVSLLAVPLAGCSKKASASSVSGTQSGQEARGANAQGMESRVQSGLAELVSAGTITQAQADKIQSALTEQMGSRTTGSGVGSGSRPSFSGGSRPDFSSGSRPDLASGSGSGRERGQGGGFGENLLSSLVSDGTITQAQADAVTQKLFSYNQNGQGTASGQSTSSQSK